MALKQATRTPASPLRIVQPLNTKTSAIPNLLDRKPATHHPRHCWVSVSAGPSPSSSTASMSASRTTKTNGYAASCAGVTPRCSAAASSAAPASPCSSQMERVPSARREATQRTARSLLAAISGSARMLFTERALGQPDSRRRGYALSYPMPTCLSGCYAARDLLRLAQCGLTPVS